MVNLYFLSKGELYEVYNGKPKSIVIGIIEKYKKNVNDIKSRKDWKTKGTGALFTGMGFSFESPEADLAIVSDVVRADEDNIFYSVILGSNSGVFKKNINENDTSDKLIIRKNDLAIKNIDFSKKLNKIVFSDKNHIAFLDVENGDIRFLTEGYCIDRNPSFNKEESSIIYYDSCGMAFDENGNVIGTGPRSIMRLNTSSYDLDEIVADGKYDFFKPGTDGEGNLYYIKRPYKSLNSKMSFKDMLLVPFKIIKAVFSFLDLFTRKYTGDALNTAGNNPAKSKQMSELDLIIEDNLINSVKALEESKKAGDKFPGVAPKNWELIKQDANGNKEIVLKGLFDYCFTPEGDIIFSNGNNIIKHQGKGQQERLCNADLATKIIL